LLLLKEELFDSRADISVIHQMLLGGVRKAEEDKSKGYRRYAVDCQKNGKPKGFFHVHARMKMKAHRISYVDVEDLYGFMYLCRGAFVVHMLGGEDLVFKRRDNLYVVDWYAEGTIDDMVQENGVVFSREEVCHAKEVHKFLKRTANSGYLPLGEAAHLLMDGKFMWGAMFMKADCKMAFKIYGLHPDYDIMLVDTK
jgi:hypothetical protein